MRYVGTTRNGQIEAATVRLVHDQSERLHGRYRGTAQATARREIYRGRKLVGNDAGPRVCGHTPKWSAGRSHDWFGPDHVRIPRGVFRYQFARLGACELEMRDFWKDPARETAD